MEPVRITRIVVKGLFGTFDHDIPLNTEERITLMIGENGMGKTVVLKMLKAVFEWNLSYLQGIDFQSFMIDFNDDVSIIFDFNREGGARKQLRGQLRGDQVSKPESAPFDLTYLDGNALRLLAPKMPPFYKLVRDEGKGKLIFEVKGVGRESFEIDEILPLIEYNVTSEEYRKLYTPRDYDPFEKNVDFWKRLDSLKAHLIETQRLLILTKEQPFVYGRDKGTFRMAVADVSNQFRKLTQTYIDEFIKISTSLDQSFPVRLAKKLNLHEEENNNWDVASEMGKLQVRRNYLRELGLYQGQGSAEDFLYEETNSPSMYPIMKVYIEDSYEKLAPFDEIASKISLFKDIINNRFKYKEIRISQEEGFAFYSTINKKRIPIEVLSSGEQHELVLFYELLFTVNPHSLILIDEPEISLHISWQNHFIDDLKEVIKLNPLDLLIATHSPSIVGSQWELAVKLKSIKTNNDA